MPHFMMPALWLPLLGAIPTDPAQRAGYIIGFLVGICLVLAVFLFAVVSVIMAFTRRTAGWIICGSISGLCVAVVGLIAVAGFVTGFGKGFVQSFNQARQQRQEATTITGSVVHFTIEKPIGWAVKRNVGAYDCEMQKGSAFVGVIAEDIRNSSTSALARIARQHIESAGSDVVLSDNEDVTLDGRTWITFTAKAKMLHLPFAYRVYVYAGRDGAVQVLGWTYQSMWDGESANLEQVMHTFHFPAPER